MELDPQTARDVSASLMRIAARSAFFATLSLFARFEASRELPTAATDGRTVFVNPAFFGGLTPAEQDGLLLHEVLHAALLHVPRRTGRDPLLWNVAADIVINGMLLREGYSLPEGGVRDPALEHLSTEEVYDRLLRRSHRPPPPSTSDLLDGRPADSPPQAGTPGEPRTAGEGERAAQERHWRNALEQAQVGAKSSVAGKLPRGIERELGSARAAQLDWRSHLWRYLTHVPTDFADFDRRFVGRGTYLETLGGESVRVLVAVDTSGSVDGREIELFAAEVVAILHAYPHLSCELYYADTKLYGPHALKPGAPLPQPRGGGGTDFRPFFERIARHPFQWGRTVAIYLTDGYGAFPASPPRCPVLWVVTPGGRAAGEFPFGEVVRLVTRA